MCANITVERKQIERAQRKKFEQTHEESVQKEIRDKPKIIVKLHVVLNLFYKIR